MSVENIVSIRSLSKIYRQGDINVTALHNISLDIQAGEFLTLMGPSGSGKSTLLHIIAGVDRPTNGECRVQSVDVTQLNESQLADWSATRTSALCSRRSISFRSSPRLKTSNCRCC